MSKLFKCLTILTSVTVFALSSATALALEVGNPAPDFSLASTQSSTTTLHQFHGKPVVLVFYPADQTPGCTFQLCSLRDHYAEFQKAGAAILASNPGDLKSHRTFAARQHYPFPLLVDANGKMAKAYGVDGLFGFNKRTVFIVDGNGVVRFMESGMPSPEKLLGVVKSLH